MSEITNNPIDLFTQMIQTIMEIPDSSLTDDNLNYFKEQFKAQVNEDNIEKSANEIISNFNKQLMTRDEVEEVIGDVDKSLKDIIDELKPSEHKKAILETVFESINGIMSRVRERYHIYDFEMYLTIDKGGKVPTYANTAAAAADLYAADTVVVPAHSLSNMIRTGIHIALPEGYAAFVLPRSSIGAKTPLRLSNSVGCIDSDYRGPIGVLYDNISDSDYTINAGDRIAQLVVMPVSHFKANVVDILGATERGEGGFGSTGK